MSKIKSALISTFYKDGLDSIVTKLHERGVHIFSTGGTQEFIESLGVSVNKVEDLTGYPSILDGRVKTLHPKVFGGILAKRSDDHLSQLTKFEIPMFDLVIVDLYPFEETVATTNKEEDIIEKIDIGGIALIRAAAKNFKDVVIIPSKAYYPYLHVILDDADGISTEDQRRFLAGRAFAVSSQYDAAIFRYFSAGLTDTSMRIAYDNGEALRYGENPHQQATFYGRTSDVFVRLSGKELSYNNIVDIDAAIQLMAEFKNDDPTFAVIKHTNACGVATRNKVKDAWEAALAGDPVSAFGGVIICNTKLDAETARLINELFYEVLIAPSFSAEALELLTAKQKRTILQLKSFDQAEKSVKSVLNGILVQDCDLATDESAHFKVVTLAQPAADEISDLKFALKCVKHLKSNAIVLVKDHQLLGMGCGHTSRVDACLEAIHKAKKFGFSHDGAVMASDAFFPFPDCVELVHQEGIRSVIQPGGSVKDQLSIDYCNANGMSMIFTGVRHFKH
jgi:phosphoribosylaminoimidazolecarboxamide formyltransferase / IMP cyclohydrolase